MTTAVECKLPSAGGARHEVGGIEYHFQPYTDGAQVAIVDDDAHADRFLSITEGFRLYRGEGQPVLSESEASADAPAARGRRKQSQ